MLVCMYLMFNCIILQLDGWPSSGHSSVLPVVSLHCYCIGLIIPHSFSVGCGVVWCAVLCCAVLCCAVLCCAVLCCML